MIINLGVAAFFGTTVPLIYEKAWKDPASSATIFITNRNDVLGFIAIPGSSNNYLYMFIKIIKEKGAL
jgi:magnesium transporter